MKSVDFAARERLQGIHHRIVVFTLHVFRVGRDDVEISSDDSFGDMGPAVVKVKSSARELKGCVT